MYSAINTSFIICIQKNLSAFDLLLKDAELSLALPLNGFQRGDYVNKS